MSRKLATILGMRGFQHELTEGPLCWLETESFDNCMFQKFKLTLVTTGGWYTGCFPFGDRISFMFSRGTFDATSCGICVVIEFQTLTGFMLFSPLYEGSTNLAYVELLAV